MNIQNKELYEKNNFDRLVYIGLFVLERHKWARKAEKQRQVLLIALSLKCSGMEVFMSGKVCPNCNKKTFFITLVGRTCTKCGYTMKILPNGGQGGKGRKCSNCNKYTVFNNKCRTCGAEYSIKQMMSAVDKNASYKYLSQ